MFWFVIDNKSRYFTHQYKIQETVEPVKWTNTKGQPLKMIYANIVGLEEYSKEPNDLFK